MSTSTTCIFLPAAMTPHPRRFETVFLGPMWPTDQPFEFLDLTGGGLPEQLVRHILGRLPAARAGGADIPRLETGIEPFDPARARAIADGGNEACWHDLCARALVHASDEELERLGGEVSGLLQSAPGGRESGREPGPEGSGPTGRPSEASAPWAEWRGKVAAALKDKMASFGLVISVTNPAQALVELRRLQDVIDRAKSVGGGLARSSLITSHRDIAAGVKSAIDQRGRDIADGMRQYARSFGTVYLAHRCSGGQLNRATFINTADVESLLQMPPPSLLRQIVGRSRVVDLVITTPVPDPRVLDALAQEWFGQTPQLHGMIWASPSYRNLDDLKVLAKSMPPGTAVGQGHVCVVAGRVHHPVLGEAIPIHGAPVGLRFQLDQVLDPSRDRWGVASPVFGPQPQNLLSGLDGCDTLAWTDEDRKEFAELGVNTLAADGGDVFLYRNRTRSRSPEMAQADSVRFRDYLAGSIRAYLDRAPIGRLNTPDGRRIIADGARALWEDFGELQGFNASLESGHSADPRTLVARLKVPLILGIEESILYFESGQPGA